MGRHDPVLALPLHLRDSLGRQRHGSRALRSSCSPLKEPLQLLVLLLAVACGAISFSHLREFGLGLKGELLKQFATELLLLLIDGMLLAERRHRLLEFSVTERVQALQTLDEPACGIELLGALSRLALLFAQLLIAELKLHGLAGLGWLQSLAQKLLHVRW